jgi:hypothetical protein
MERKINTKVIPDKLTESIDLRNRNDLPVGLFVSEHLGCDIEKVRIKRERQYRFNEIIIPRSRLRCKEHEVESAEFDDGLPYRQDFIK